jgi:hypothetical protein
MALALNMGHAVKERARRDGEWREVGAERVATIESVGCVFVLVEVVLDESVDQSSGRKNICSSVFSQSTVCFVI